jgi:predicted AAA+ superfamily ATPase
MIVRRILPTVLQRLEWMPVVALLGSRQVGKTTLAREIQIEKTIHYPDLERPSDLAKLADPELYLKSHSGKLIVLDEIQRLPELFPVIRSLVDDRRRAGESAAQFLILGSASPELLRQFSETLAGRITYLELTPFQLLELEDSPSAMSQHWFRGGYPGSYLAPTDQAASQWCDDFVTTYVESHLPQLGVGSSPQQLRRLCSMLAHQQGATLNLAKVGGSLGIDGKTVRHYIDLLEGLFLLRRLPAWGRNAGKRLVKAPKVYWRDTGLLHMLSGLPTLEHVLGHPLCGHSWEGYCIEQILTVLSKNTQCSHYRTHAKAEVDLVLENSAGEITAIEIKRTLSPKLTPGFLESTTTLGAHRGYYIIPDGDAYPLSESVEAVSLRDFLQRLKAENENPEGRNS